METGSYSADLIEVRVAGFFKTKHTFHTLSQDLGTLLIKGGKSCGMFHGADNENYQIEQPSIWKKYYQIREENKVLGAAKPPGFFSRNFLINLEGTLFALTPEKFWSNKYYLIDVAGQIVASVLSRGVFKRGALVSVYQPIPLILLVLAYFLVTKSWHEQNTAAA